MIAKRAAGILALGLLSAVSMAAVTINVNRADGESLSGAEKFVVRVTAPSLVTSVEFYVGDSLRDTDSSTPYEFTIDTLTEKEGDLVVRFDAYTENGEKGTKTLRLKVDNGLGKGIEFHLDKARDFLSNSKWDDAIASGRIALKINPNSNPARIVMARANFGKGVMDLAQKFVEDVIANEPQNTEALELSAGINLERAFSAFTTSGTRAETISTIGTALRRAAETRKASLEARVDALPALTQENKWSQLPALMAAARYSRIIEILTPHVDKNPKDTAAQNWLVYSMVRAGRFQAATRALASYEKFGSIDGYGYALKAILFAYGNNDAISREAEKNAILDDPSSVPVKTAQIYLALRRRDVRTFATLVTDLNRIDDGTYIAAYYKATLAHAGNDFTLAQDLMKRALMAEPSAYDVFVERANQQVIYAMGSDVNAEERGLQLSLARAYVEAALVARPESFQALTGLSIISTLQGRNDDAIRFGRAAAAAAPEYAPGHYALAAAYMSARRNSESREAMKNAERMDPSGLTGRPVPNAEIAFRYFYSSGRVPLMSTPPVPAS